MSEDKEVPEVPPRTNEASLEERDAATVAAVVTAGSSVVTAASALYTAKHSKPSEPDSLTDPPPQVVLPPGVDDPSGNG